MGYIKEPKGIDFIINSRPLTKDEETAISSYIQAYKSKHTGKKTDSKPKGTITKNKKVKV